MDEFQLALKKLVVTEQGLTWNRKKRMLASIQIAITTAKDFAKNATQKNITEKGFKGNRIKIDFDFTGNHRDSILFDLSYNF